MPMILQTAAGGYYQLSPLVIIISHIYGQNKDFKVGIDKSDRNLRDMVQYRTCY